jgi:hypothetical protein
MIFDKYVDARSAFLAAARDRSAAITEHLLPGAKGREGEALAMDVVTLGDQKAPKALLVVSGTHGLEGLPGSGAQLEILLRTALPAPDVKIVLVHAINPWGVSHGSRTNEDNVDTNRNFVDFSAPVVRNAAYDDIFPYLCPEDWTDEVFDRLNAQVKHLLDTHGYTYVLDGMTAGQRQEPTGTNFGGHAPSWTRTTLEEVVRTELGCCEKVAFVEWHTGFGDYTDAFFLCKHPAGSEALERVAAWWGREAVSNNAAAFQNSGGATPNWTGMFAMALQALIPDVAVAGSIVEFGTFPNAEVRAAIMIDRFLKFGRRNLTSTSADSLRQQMLEGFAPKDEVWRTAILQRSQDVHDRALAGLVAW